MLIFDIFFNILCNIFGNQLIMKRLIAFISIVLLSFLVLLSYKNNKIFDCNYEKFVVVTKNENLLKDCEKIVNGDNVYFIVEKEQKDKVENLNFSDTLGVVFYFNKNIKFNNFNRRFNYSLSGGKSIEGRQVFYGYDKNYSDFRLIENKKVNVQLVRTENEWILGYPLILTGF